MTAEGNADTFVYPLSGRDITFLKTQPQQLTMLRRYTQVQQALMVKAEAAKDERAYIDAATRIHEAAWTAVESRFTDPDDLEFVRLEVIAGKLGEGELFVILSNGVKATVPDDDADPVVAKQRAVKKNAAKNTAAKTTSRAKR